MIRIERYEDLLAKVEAGDAHAVDIAARRMASEARDQGGSFPALWVLKAHNGSLDAAKSLHEALLPGWVWIFPHKDNCRVYRKDFNAHRTGYSRDNPARAWLLAILKALIEQEKANV